MCVCVIVIVVVVVVVIVTQVARKDAEKTDGGDADLISWSPKQIEEFYTQELSTQDVRAWGLYNVHVRVWHCFRAAARYASRT